METPIILSIIVPVFNEEEVVMETYRRLTKIVRGIEENYEIVFVNDGSFDSTSYKIKKICNKDYHVKLINFSRNFGHQAAITAGMKCSRGKAIIVIDADLQDPPEVIIEMVKKWREGYKVVYGKRISREGETIFKKVTAKLFYRFLNYFSDIKIPTDTGDFRLIDRKVCNVMNGLPEHNRYIRGLVTWVGFSQTGVEFVREKRLAGETKYPLKKMIRFSLDAITSFSSKPLKLASPIGIIISLGSLLYLI
ncbi:glycosyltransferase family 2 protein, partial [Clostridiaceae bacterium UIB06]|nr:glycosyltransferase family 2 protein [Clostridiaceae bacterium UIB06]